MRAWWLWLHAEERSASRSLSACRSVCLPLRLSLSLSVSVSGWLSAAVSVCLSGVSGMRKQRATPCVLVPRRSLPSPSRRLRSLSKRRAARTANTFEFGAVSMCGGGSVADNGAWSLGSTCTPPQNEHRSSSSPTTTDGSLSEVWLADAVRAIRLADDDDDDGTSLRWKDAREEEDEDRGVCSGGVLGCPLWMPCDRLPCGGVGVTLQDGVKRCRLWRRTVGPLSPDEMDAASSSSGGGGA